MVIEANSSFQGTRFNTCAGDRKIIRYASDKPDFTPTLVSQARAGQAIDWGGAAVQPQDYKVLFDAIGPLPPAFRR